MTDPEGLPLVSVITPAYNRAVYLEETIMSVLSQDYPNLEYLVLDDGSTDNTRDVAAKYVGRIIFSSHPNMGETRTVNKGFAMATGSIIGVVNSDDPLLPGAVAQIVDTMIKEPEVIVAYPDWDMIDAEGYRFGHRQTFEYDYVNMVRWFHCVPGPGAFFRHSLMKELGGRDEQFRYVADFDFWLRAGLIGPFKRVPKTLATFRSHSDSTSSKARGRLMAVEHVRLGKEAVFDAKSSAGSGCGQARSLRERLLHGWPKLRQFVTAVKETLFHTGPRISTEEVLV